MVFTQRIHLDILDNNQLIMVLVEDRAIDQVPHVLLITLGEIEHRLCVPGRSLPKPFSLRILPDTLEDCLYGPRQFLDPLLGLLWA